MDNAIAMNNNSIFSKGFGQLVKSVMLDKTLSIEAKAIYAYFSSYSGNGSNSIYPSRDKILSDLNISKSCYYDHYKLLRASSEGYFMVSKASRDSNQSFINKNVYTVKKQTQGYGIIPKAVMWDKRLTLTAKGIYAYFSVFADKERAAIPLLKNILYHLGISETRYYKHLRLLIEYGYISAERQKDEKGRFTGCLYILNIIPDEEAGKKEIERRRVVQEKKKKIRETISGIVNAVRKSTQNLKNVIEKSEKKHSLKDEFIRQLKRNIEYEAVSSEISKAAAGRFVDIILEYSFGMSVLHVNGEPVLKEQFIEKMLKLNKVMFIRAYERFTEKTKDGSFIRNSDAYIAAVLYNSL